MILSKFLALAASAVAVIATQPTPTPSSDDPLAGANIVEMQWSVRAFPNGEFVNASGTVQEVIAHLSTINPEFEKNLSTKIANGSSFSPDGQSLYHPGDRPNYHYKDYFCFERWPPAERMRIIQGIWYLENLEGIPTIPAGPATCSRVSCSWRAAIYWCNDNDHELQLRQWKDVAWGAYSIWNNCQYTEYLTAGQLFWVENWNVIVRGDAC